MFYVINEIAIIARKRFSRAIVLESTLVNHTRFINLTNYATPTCVNRKENYVIIDSRDDKYRSNLSAH